jgi:hypothetical protein
VGVVREVEAEDAAEYNIIFLNIFI